MAFTGLLLLALQLTVPPVGTPADGARTPKAINRAATPMVPGPRLAIAVRTHQPITLDGRADDAAWAATTPVDGFRMFDPTEAGEPKLRTMSAS